MQMFKVEGMAYYKHFIIIIVIICNDLGNHVSLLLCSSLKHCREVTHAVKWNKSTRDLN